MSDIEETDKYEPVDPNYYSFKGVDSLYQDYEEYLEFHNNTRVERVNLCVYQVLNDGKYPFLQFLLLNELGMLSFISIENNLYIDNSKLIEFSKNYLSTCLNLAQNVLEQPYVRDENIEYKGFYIYNNEMYLFLDVTKYQLLLNDVYRENMLWFALVDEIVNIRMLSGMPISPNVVEFFSLNSQFIFLYDTNGDKYEIPSIAYVIAPEDKTNFTFVFGVSSSNSESIFGPYYYFTNYENCLRQLKTLKQKIVVEKKEPNMGIIRFGLFLEKTKVVENLETDDNDESDIKKERLDDESCDVNYERMTIRISDHDGNWTEKYNSIILGNVRLDDGSLMKNVPVICVKEYEQQYPLSYHFIGKNKFNSQLSIL
jgi:hypothetical protein